MNARASKITDLGFYARLHHAVEVSGASMGIGLELARLFAREGPGLVLVARSEDKLNELGRELEGAPARISSALTERGIIVDYLSFSEALAEELRGTEVHVTAYGPGPVATEFARTAGNAASVLFKLAPAASAAQVARGAYDALASSRVVAVHGFTYWIGVQMLRLSPRALIRRSVGWINSTTCASTAARDCETLPLSSAYLRRAVLYAERAKSASRPEDGIGGRSHRFALGQWMPGPLRQGSSRDCWAAGRDAQGD